MSSANDLISDLRILNDIAQALNRAADVRSALDESLAQLVRLLGLDAAWIFLRDPADVDPWWGTGFKLAAHHNLPPAMALDNPDAWKGGCDCQGLCNKDAMDEAYNEVSCTRLKDLTGDRRGLRVHASAPLRSGGQVLGILNVAAPSWQSFSPRMLALLTNVGAQMGTTLERAHLFDLLKEQRTHEQAALLRLSNQLLNRLDLDDIVAYLVQEAMNLLGVDACALLLPDEEQQFLRFRAAAGWRSDPVAEGRQVPADERSGSGQVLLGHQPLLLNWPRPEGEVPDWTAEWLDVEGFKAAAIVPLLLEEKAIGVMVVDTREPRVFELDEIRFLQLLANQAAIAIETSRLHQQEMERQLLEEELALGQQIQLSLLPKSCPTVPGWQFCDIYKSARQVGGDFYDFFELPGDHRRLGLVIADVSDKGVPAALFMGVSRTLIRSAALSGLSPAATLEQANKLILQESQSDLFLSAFYSILDTQNGNLTFANAGHNPPLWYQSNTGEVHSLSTDGIILCILDDISLNENSIEVANGDVLVFYTDGVTEAINAQFEEFGDARLREVVATNASGTATQILNAIVRAVDNFAGDTDQADDFTLYIVKRLS
jgi:sigma-B regulation protein RsbU (phosphoserine phosphatase)